MEDATRDEITRALDACLDEPHPLRRGGAGLVRLCRARPLLDSLTDEELRTFFFPRLDRLLEHVRGWPGYFDFVRMFSQYAEQDAAWHQMITVRFACPPGAKLGLRGSVYADLDDLPAFFGAVESSGSFRAGLGYSGWSFEVRLDCA